MQRLLAVFLCGLVSSVVLAATPVEQLEQLLAKQRYAEAAERGKALLDSDPAQHRARFLTAYAYQMSGQSDRAERLYLELIAARPELPEPRNNLAMIYLERGDYNRASQLLVDAINTHPSYATAYDNLNRIYKAIASEAYRRAVSESSEPAKYRHDIELTALASLATLAPEAIEENGGEALPGTDNADLDEALIARVKAWARAWSNKDFAAYAGFYAPGHRADFASHEQWLASRRKRILRPGEIRVELSDVRVRWRSDNRAIVDFTQAFDSPTYSDRVVKRLDFDRVGSEWKIIGERVLSVL